MEEERLAQLLKRVRESNGDGQINQLVEELTAELKVQPLNIPVLKARAELYTRLQLFGQAINDYRMILQVDPHNAPAKAQIEHLSTILRFRNTDIFENPNTTFDPWLE
jgi:hypothetical protein